MKYKVRIIDYHLFHEKSMGYFEGDAKIEIANNLSLNVFISDLKLLSLLGSTNMRGKKIDVDLRISPGVIEPVGTERKLILEITYRNSAPNYLFIGEVIKKEDKNIRSGLLFFDCGIMLDVEMNRNYFYEQIRKGEYILVIGRPDIFLIDEKNQKRVITNEA